MQLQMGRHFLYLIVTPAMLFFSPEKKCYFFKVKSYWQKGFMWSFFRRCSSLMWVIKIKISGWDVWSPIHHHHHQTSVQCCPLPVNKDKMDTLWGHSTQLRSKDMRKCQPSTIKNTIMGRDKTLFCQFALHSKVCRFYLILKVFGAVFFPAKWHLIQ